MSGFYRNSIFFLLGVSSGALALSRLQVEKAEVGQRILILSVDDSIQAPDLGKIQIEGYEIENAVFVEELSEDSTLFTPNYLDLTSGKNGRVLEYAPIPGIITLETPPLVIPQVGTVLADTAYGGIFRKVLQVESQSKFSGPTRRWILKTVEADFSDAVIRCDLAFQTRLDLNLTLPDTERSEGALGASTDGSPVFGQTAFSLQGTQILFQPRISGRLRIVNGQVDVFQFKVTGICEVSGTVRGGVSGKGTFEYESELAGRPPLLVPLGAGLFVKVRNRPFFQMQADSRGEEFWAQAEYRIQNSIKGELGFELGQWRPLAENKTLFASKGVQELRGEGQIKMGIKPRVEILLAGRQGSSFTFESFARLRSTREDFSPGIGAGAKETSILGRSSKEFSLGSNIFLDARTNFAGPEILKSFTLFSREQIVLAPPKEGSLSLKEADSNRVYLLCQAFPRADYFLIQQKAGSEPWETLPEKATLPKYRLEHLKASTQYRFRAIAVNSMGASPAFPAEGIAFTTPAPNHPPLAPALYFPDSGAVLQDSALVLSWKGGDPDPGNKVTYDVYLDTRFPPLAMWTGGLTDTSLRPVHLKPGTTYYWKVAAWDGWERVESAIRTFTLKSPVTVDSGMAKVFPWPYPMVYLPKGSFRREDGKVVHVSAFLMEKFEVTQADFQKVMGKNPSYRLQDSLPVDRVTWEEASTFCRETGGRLPTEAEWEYAARGGNASTFYWGGENPNDYAWYRENSENRSRKVGLKKPNAWGLHDMAGNVFEWVQDWYGEYLPSDLENPRGPEDGVSKVIRGASWYSEMNTLNLTSRFSNRPGFRNFKVGFRCARDADHSAAEGEAGDPLAAKTGENPGKVPGQRAKP